MLFSGMPLSGVRSPTCVEPKFKFSSDMPASGERPGGVNLFDISGKSDWAQRQAVRYSWCEVWHDPKQNGDFVTGWVYGKYIRPH